MTSTNEPGTGATAFPPPAAPIGVPQLMPSSPDQRRSKKPLVAAIAVIAILGAGVGVFIATRSSDDDTDNKAGATQSTLVRFNDDDQQLEVLDSSGDVVDSFGVRDASEANFVTGLAGRVLLDASQNGEIVVMKVADGTVDRLDVPDGLNLSRAFTTASTNIVLESGVGGDVVVIDLETGDTTSALDEVGDPDSKFIPARRLGSASTYSDVGSSIFQTLVVPNVGGDLWLIPGGVPAIDGARSLAVEQADGESTVSIYERDKATGSIEIDGSVAGGLLLGDDAALVVTFQGDIVKVDLGDDDATIVGSLPDTIRFAVGLSDDRLFVVGDQSSSYLLDAAGETIAEFEPVDDEDGNPLEIALGPGGFRSGSRCFITQPGSSARQDGGDVALRDLSTGDVVAEFDGSAAMLDTPDGCTAASTFDSTADIVLDGEVHEYDGYANVIAVSPDLKQVVVGGADGFALIDVESGDETELDRYPYAFVTN